MPAALICLQSAMCSSQVLAYSQPALGEELGGVPDAVDRVGVVHDQELAVVRADLDGAGQQGVLDRLAGDVEARRGQQLAQVGERVLGHQAVEVDLAGAGVVDHVRRGAVDEARLEGLADLLRRRVLDLRLRVRLVVHGLVGLGVLLAEAAVEDHHLERARPPSPRAGSARSWCPCRCSASPLSSSPPPVAQPASRPAAGVARRPAAAVRRRMSRLFMVSPRIGPGGRRMGDGGRRTRRGGICLQFATCC